MSTTHKRRFGPDDGHRFVSIPNAAEYLACEHKLVRKMITTGKVRGYRLPGSRLIRVDLNELDALMAGTAA